MMRRLLGNDLVINENDCNLSCRYCLTGQSNIKQSHREQLIFKPPRRDRYGPATPLGERVDTIIARIAETFETPILKITGGEVFLVDHILDLVDAAALRFPSVILQTNGALIGTEQIERLKAHPNVTIQISLDSHLFEANSFRVARKDLHDKIVAKITALLRAELPTEIYCVLNVRSIERLESFAAWLNGYNGELQFFPFPVRGPEISRFAVAPHQIRHVEALLDRYDCYQRILPPKAYFRRMLRFLKEGGRTFRCHLPRLVISTFSDGAVTACPNIWFSDLGNVTRSDWQTALTKVGETPLYQALLGPRPRLEACRRCFTPWDLLSMYFDEEISIDELCCNPAYRAPAVRAYLAQAKASYELGGTA